MRQTFQKLNMGLVSDRCGKRYRRVERSAKRRYNLKRELRKEGYDLVKIGNGTGSRY